MTERKFEELVRIFKRLRDPESGCPWDIKQTHQSLVKHLLEETYELKDAIENEPDNLKEELGDVLLQIMLHSQIADDQNNFNIYDVIDTLSQKLIDRHPHVFGELEVADAEEVKKNWDKIKSDQRVKSGSAKSGRLAGIPKSAPALFQSDLIGKKVAAVDFDWDSPEEVINKVDEELEELKLAKTKEEQAEELGDLFFTLAQYARKLGFSAEDICLAANNKFINRFEKMEAINGGDLADTDKPGLAKLWQSVKS